MLVCADLTFSKKKKESIHCLTDEIEIVYLRSLSSIQAQFIFSALYSMYCTIYTVLYVLYHMYCTLCTVLYYMYCTLCTVLYERLRVKHAHTHILKSHHFQTNHAANPCKLALC